MDTYIFAHCKYFNRCNNNCAVSMIDVTVYEIIIPHSVCGIPKRRRWRWTHDGTADKDADDDVTGVLGCWLLLPICIGL